MYALVLCCLFDSARIARVSSGDLGINTCSSSSLRALGMSSVWLLYAHFCLDTDRFQTWLAIGVKFNDDHGRCLTASLAGVMGVRLPSGSTSTSTTSCACITFRVRASPHTNPLVPGVAPCTSHLPCTCHPSRPPSGSALPAPEANTLHLALASYLPKSANMGPLNC